MELQPKPTKYERNKPYVMKYYKKRYNEDEAFKSKETARIYEINKKKYNEDEDFKNKRREYSRLFHLKKRVQSLKNDGEISKIQYLLNKYDKTTKEYDIIVANMS